MCDLSALVHKLSVSDNIIKHDPKEQPSIVKTQPLTLVQLTMQYMRNKYLVDGIPSAEFVSNILTYPSTIHLRGCKYNLCITLLRDIVAYMILDIVILCKGKVFGGFVRDHISGFDWDDMDISFTNGHNIYHFKKMLCRQLRRFFGASRHLEKFQLRLDKKLQNINYNFSVHKHILTCIFGEITFDIKLDITSSLEARVPGGPWDGDRGPKGRCQPDERMKG